jgi:hypothetical protein
MNKEIVFVLSVAVLGIATLVAVPASYMTKENQLPQAQYKVLDHEVQLVHLDGNLISVNQEKTELPSGYRVLGNFSWNSAGDRVAYYVEDNASNTKLVITDRLSCDSMLLDPPSGTKYDLDILPIWLGNEVMFSAGSKVYTTTKK